MIKLVAKSNYRHQELEQLEDLIRYIEEDPFRFSPSVQSSARIDYLAGGMEKILQSRRDMKFLRDKLYDKRKILRRSMTLEKRKPTLTVDELPLDVRESLEKYGSLQEAYDTLSVRLESINDYMKMTYSEIKSNARKLLEVPETTFPEQTYRVLSQVAGETKKTHKHSEKLGLIIILVTSLGVGSWLWIFNVLQQPISTVGSVISTGGLTMYHILFSIVIFAALIYGLEHLHK